MDNYLHGKKRGYEILEIVICSHGPAHNDTLCTVERKLDTHEPSGKGE